MGSHSSGGGWSALSSQCCSGWHRPAPGIPGLRTLSLPRSLCCHGHQPTFTSWALRSSPEILAMFRREGSPNGPQLCKCSRCQWAKMLFPFSLSEPRPGKINNSLLYIHYSTFSAVLLLSWLLFWCNSVKRHITEMEWQINWSVFTAFLLNPLGWGSLLCL